MEGPGQPPSTDRLTALVGAGDREAAVSHLQGFLTEEADARKRAVQSLREIADDDPAPLDGLVPALVPFLEDEDRAIRLSTAKLFVAVAESDPDAVRPVVSAVADRLADEGEFYYVRARSAEALGYVALEHPDEVDSPEILADLRVGLSFDEPEVKAKLAKALECVALGDPRRLRHQVSDLTGHLDDEDPLVRYHLATALAAIGCVEPGRLADAVDALEDRIDDDEARVRGRAAEALGLAASANGVGTSLPAAALEDLRDDEEPFVARRAAFALDAVGKAAAATGADDVGTLDGVRTTTEAAVEAITAPDADGGCPHCGLSLPAEGPPLCPRCGAPR